MKKIFLILMIVLFPCNVFAEEIQLTDYDFTSAKKLLDKFTYVAHSDEYIYGEKKYFNTESNILKANGTMLYNSADYTVYYNFFDAYNGQGVTYNEGYRYPQSVTGKDFIVHKAPAAYNDTWEESLTNAVMNSDGKLLTKFGFGGFCDSLSNYYYICDIGHKNYGILDLQTEEAFYFKKEADVYYNADNGIFATVIYDMPATNNKTNVKIELYKGKEKIETYENEAIVYNFDFGYRISNADFSYLATSLIYKKMEFVRVSMKRAGGYSKGDVSPVYMDYKSGNIVSYRMDDSYVIKEKIINGVKYYALFKELKDGESAADFIPTERPDGQYSDNIDKMAADKLLYNNELCFFDRGITKLDFGIVLGRAYCRAVNYNIDNFTSDTHFVDVNHPYCLYLADKRILGSDNDLYINEKAISQSTVLSALNKIAAENHILAEWSKVKEIQDTEEECSRELAYSEIYKLYDLLQNPDTPKDIGAMSGIYIITGSLFILSVGALLNDKSKRKIKNQPVYGSKESLI
ncbi:MAG: hypothetical protein IJ062_09580 [Firmicutes bacterium]|nr:hypothetical protein [Bacillota bacterium]